MEDLRRLCECDLDCAMLFAIERAIDYVLHRRKKIHSQTLETQQYFITLCKGR